MGLLSKDSKDTKDAKDAKDAKKTEDAFAVPGVPGVLGVPCLIIAHRGASGYRPEHTLAAYELAIDLGADFIEPDLVMTRDGVLIARHDNELSATTDVAEHLEFAGRQTTKTVDGREWVGWFSEDFTLAEIKTLRARERIPELRPQNTTYDGRFAIPTLAEVIALAQRRSTSSKAIGIYPETKHPSYFASLGLAMEEPLVALLHETGYRDRKASVFIQSFETGNLKRLRRLTELPLVQLLADFGQPWDLEASGDPRSFADLATSEGLAAIAGYADAIGPGKNLIVPRTADDRLLAPTDLVDRAHRAGLAVHAWTFRAENAFLPADLRRGDPHDPAFHRALGDAAAELRLFSHLKVDGVFTDHPDVPR